MIVVAAICWYLLRSTPEQLLERGLAESDHDPVAAAHLFQRAVNAAAGRDYPDAQIALCRLLLRRNSRQEASSLFTAINCQECRTDLLLGFGRDALRMEQRPEGLAALESVARRDVRERLVALELLMSDYQEWGQRQKQLQIAESLTEMQPQNPQRWSDLIELQTSMARESECVATIQRALQQDFPVEFLSHLQNSLVQQLVNQGDVRGARRELENLRKLESDSLRVRGSEVYVCRLEGDLEKSLQIVTTIVDDAPDLPFPRFTRGVVLLDLRRFNDAKDDLERVIAAQPFNAPAQFKISEAYRGLGKEDLAAKHQRLASEIAGKQIRITSLLKQRDEDPYDPMIYRELEKLHRELGDSEAARHWHRWGVRVSPQNSLIPSAQISKG
jgi:tetratricopeptide (TPR) repeat protein